MLAANVPSSARTVKGGAGSAGADPEDGMTQERVWYESFFGQDYLDVFAYQFTEERAAKDEFRGEGPRTPTR